MAYKEILVVVDNAAGAAQRVAPAAALAAIFGARLTGYFASGYPLTAGYGDMSGMAELVETYMSAQRTEAKAAEAAFRQALAGAKQPGAKLTGDWQYHEAEATPSVIAQAVLYDLIVVGQPNPDNALENAFGLRPRREFRPYPTARAGAIVDHDRLSEPRGQTLRDLVTGLRGAAYNQDGVFTGDSAEDLPPSGCVDRLRDRLRARRECVQDDQLTDTIEARE